MIFYRVGNHFRRFILAKVFCPFISNYCDPTTIFLIETPIVDLETFDVN